VNNAGGLDRVAKMTRRCGEAREASNFRRTQIDTTIA
jgi:hypothetical protein